MLSLDSLNPAQRAAVEHVDGPLLILAGAGSGKTRVLTQRIGYLLQQEKAKPWQVMAVTFTNKAAGELKERVTQVVGPSGREVIVGTFHSICSRLLRREWRPEGRDHFSIYDDGDQERVIKAVMAALKVPDKQISVGAVRGAISHAKNELITPERFEPVTYVDEFVRRIYDGYQRRLRENNALDFDDLIMQTVLFLRANEERRVAISRRYRYISVDEYQDTNHAQYTLVKLLASEHGNLCVVGDDDQSIYGWRGADIRNILNFEQDYPTATVIKLEQNYRSTQTILDAAHAVVSLNRGRKEKKLWTKNEGGVPIHRFVAQDEVQEATWVAHEIMRLRGRGTAVLRDCAVMYRTNAQSRVIEEAFNREALPYLLIGGVRFYERREIKDVIAYLRLIANPRDDVALDRIINVPPRTIGPKVTRALHETAERDEISLRHAVSRAAEIPELPPAGQRSVVAFDLMLARLTDQAASMNVLDLLDEVLSASGYAEWLRDGTDEGEERWNNVKELRSLALDYTSLPAGTGLTALLENIALVADTDRLPDAEGGPPADKVTLITLHAAKGLEYPIVFITGLEEGLFPHSRSLDDPRQMEEERRLAYVGITRAKEHLYLLGARRRTVFGNTQATIPSRFVEDIPSTLIEAESRPVSVAVPPRVGLRPVVALGRAATWQEEATVAAAMPPAGTFVAGERVRHNLFGPGTILQSEVEGRADVVLVQFVDKAGKAVKKTLDTNFAKLDHL
jgi:DNA helicase-2/ATP-dependent DNA helicase PcrA